MHLTNKSVRKNMEHTDGSHTITNLFENCTVKERNVNFSKEEENKLLALVRKNKHVLLSTKTDWNTCKQKEQVWLNITEEFNANAQTLRTMKKLKYKVDNMKRSARKVANKKHQEVVHKGSQPPHFPPPSEDTDWVQAVISSSIDGNKPLYDDDVTQSSVSVPKVETSANVALGVEAKPSQHKQFEVQIEYDSSPPHCLEEKPKAPPLKRKLRMKQDNNYIKKLLQKQKINVLEELKEIEIDKLKMSLKHQKELHEQTLRHNEERHRLHILKLQLEIDILETDKRKKNT